VRITEIALIRNLRSVEEITDLALGQISVFVGPNNSGKSSILQSVLALQSGTGMGAAQVRLGADMASAVHRFTDLQGFSGFGEVRPDRAAQVEVTIERTGAIGVTVQQEGPPDRVDQIPAREPDHLIVPLLSQRRPERFEEQMNAETSFGVYPNLRFLGAKLFRIVQPGHPSNPYFSEACQKILGVPISMVQSANGSVPGVFVGATDAIPLSEMGAGVAHIVGLLADLALAEGKIVLIEEPESDLHPAALHALLELIGESAKRNQFLVSTHSNIVLRYLGSLDDALIYYVDSDQRGAWPPRTVVREVRPEPGARGEVLIELGYELSDFEFYEGWLFLEEASAESIIRDHLIPWFTPGLAGRLRTVSAKGSSRVGPIFDDFNRLVLFTHLEERYRNRAWVIVDGDKSGAAVVEKLRKSYKAWDADHFQALGEPNFERYYPDRFNSQAAEALSHSDAGMRRDGKRELLHGVLAWIAAEPEPARAEFEKSAAEPIALLRSIETELVGRAQASQA
jgi:AAA domain, putative AbiEii toxin, Type IV TA system